MSYKPKTMKELEDEFNAIQVPQEVTRFCINEDKKEPKWFGIFQNDDGDFIVYKNKADGSRFVRYKGKNEEEAVGIYYDKFVDEVNLRRRKRSVKEVQSTKDMKRTGEHNETTEENFKDLIDELKTQLWHFKFGVDSLLVTGVFCRKVLLLIIRKFEKLLDWLRKEGFGWLMGSIFLFLIIFVSLFISHISEVTGSYEEYYKRTSTEEYYYRLDYNRWYRCNQRTKDWEEVDTFVGDILPEDLVQLEQKPSFYNSEKVYWLTSIHGMGWEGAGDLEGLVNYEEIFAGPIIECSRFENTGKYKEYKAEKEESSSSSASNNGGSKGGSDSSYSDFDSWDSNDTDWDSDW